MIHNDTKLLPICIYDCSNAYALPNDDPRELLELARPLERPLTEEPLLADAKC